MNIKSSILLRVRIAFLLVLIFACAIVYKIVELQYLDGGKWQQLAKDIGLQYKTVKATRGSIYADNGALLATSLPFYRLAFDPKISDGKIMNQGIDSLSMLLAKKFKEGSPSFYKQRILEARKKGKRYLMLSRNQINYQDKKEISQWPIFREGRHKGGVIFEKVDKRYLPFSELGMRTIGFLNDEKRGMVGLEYSFNEYLAGQNGKALSQKIAGGVWKPVYDGSEVPALDGYDVETTIDINLQDVTEAALLKHLKLHDADFGCAIIMEVKTGEIKAISNLGKNQDGDYWERYNYSVAGLTEPGSTFKLASMMALFEDSNLSLTDTVATGEGEYEFYDRVMRDHKPDGYGTLTVLDIFSKSSNIGVSKLVEDHFGSRPQRYLDYIKKFGLHEPMGFQLKGEGVPYIKNPEDKSWSGITLPWMSIGYELKLSPLHTLAFYNAVANDGTFIRPILVKRIKKADRVIKEFKTTVLEDKICSEATLAKVKLMLSEVVEHGTANNISNANYKIAGKTGTAQKVINGRYARLYYTSFAGYFPADNPKYSCIVVIDSPKGYRQYGSDVAAPVFKEVADKIYSRDLGLHDPYTEEVAAVKGVFPVIQAGNFDELNYLLNELGISNHQSGEQNDWVRAKKNNNSIVWENNSKSPNAIPNVEGMTLRDALYNLENLGLRVQYIGIGRVKDQSLIAGSKVVKGSLIKLKLG